MMRTNNTVIINSIVVSIIVEIIVGNAFSPCRC